MAEPYQSVIGAFCERIKSSPQKKNLVGGVFAIGTPGQGPLMFPNAVVLYGKTKFQWTTEKTYHEKPQLELQVFAERAEDSELISRGLWETLLDQPLPALNGYLVQCYMTDFYIVEEPGKGPQGNNLYRGTTPFELWVT